MLRRLVPALVAGALLVAPVYAQRIGVGVGVGVGGSGGGGGMPSLSSLTGGSLSDAATGSQVARPASTLSGCSWTISSQSNFAQVGGTGVVTKAAASVAAGTYTPATTCTVTNADQTITISAPLVLTIGASAAPSALLMGSRYNQMGYGGYTGSDGTDTDSNSRIGSFNETGATVTKLRGYFTNWFANQTNEQDGYNSITVRAAVEYPAGTFTPLTFSGASSVAIAASGSSSLAESDEATLATAIPAGAQYWVRTFVSVASGGKWPQGYLIAASGGSGMGEAADFSTGVDRTASGTITNAAPSSTRRGYGPVAIKATAFSGSPVAKAFAGVGDSLIMGSTDALDAIASGHGNIGYLGKAVSGSYPYINLGIAGTTAMNNVPANFTRRAALLAKIGVTHIFSDWSINDLTASRTAAQLAGNVSSIAQGFKTAVPGVKVIWATLTPYTTSSDGWKTTANQTIRTTPSGAFTGGSSSIRSQFNATLRGGISGVDFVFDAADNAETARDSGVWRAGEGSTHLTNSGATTDAFTSDGLHPAALNTTSPGLGGIYVLRDAVRTAMPGW